MVVMFTEGFRKLPKDNEGHQRKLKAICRGIYQRFPKATEGYENLGLGFRLGCCAHRLPWNSLQYPSVAFGKAE